MSRGVRLKIFRLEEPVDEAIDEGREWECPEDEGVRGERGGGVCAPFPLPFEWVCGDQGTG